MILPSRSIVHTLPSFLTWKAGNDLVRDACLIHIHWAFGKLQLEVGSHDISLYSRINALPKLAQKRIVLSPHFVRIMKGVGVDRKDVLSEVKSLVDVEEALLGICSASENDSWSALGDAYCHDGKVVAIEKYSAGGKYVDTLSPRLPYITGSSGRPRIHCTARERESALEKMRAAISWLRTACPVASEMFHSTVQVCGLSSFKDNSPHRHGSSSNPNGIGNAGFIGLHVDKCSVMQVADYVVHEAIHNLLYKIELLHGMYSDAMSQYETMVISPWSGRRLRLHSYTHACFVWYGLWHLWASAAEGGVTDELIQKAASGFKSSAHIESLSAEARKALRPDVLEIISTLPAALK